MNSKIKIVLKLTHLQIPFPVKLFEVFLHYLEMFSSSMMMYLRSVGSFLFSLKTFSFKEILFVYFDPVSCTFWGLMRSIFVHFNILKYFWNVFFSSLMFYT